MSGRMTRQLLAVAIVAAVAMVNVCYAAELYTITPIPPLPPNQASGSRGIAPSAGYVVGNERTASGYSGFRWQSPGPLVEIQPLGTDSWCDGYAVNDSGHVAGFSGPHDSWFGTAWVWDGTTVTALPNLPGFVSRANDINNSGLIVGGGKEIATLLFFACMWDGGTVSVVGTGYTQSGRSLTVATGVNEGGQVVGAAANYSTGELDHAFFWDGDPSHDALDLPDLPDAFHGVPHAINDVGQAVGWALIVGPEGIANVGVFWDTDHSVHEIPPLPGAVGSSASDINNAGWVVGNSECGPWVWHEAEGTFPLEALLVGPDAALWDLGPPVGGADGIDNQGRIAGTGTYNGQTTAFLATPVSLLITSLIQDVELLVDEGFLNQGQGNALVVKLDQSLDRLDEGHLKPAINLLGAFSNQVEAFVQDGVLLPLIGQELSDQANDIIELLSGPEL